MAENITSLIYCWDLFACLFFHINIFFWLLFTILLQQGTLTNSYPICPQKVQGSQHEECLHLLDHFCGDSTKRWQHSVKTKHFGSKLMHQITNTSLWIILITWQLFSPSIPFQRAKMFSENVQILTNVSVIYHSLTSISLYINSSTFKLNISRKTPPHVAS